MNKLWSLIYLLPYLYSIQSCANTEILSNQQIMRDIGIYMDITENINNTLNTDNVSKDKLIMAITDIVGEMLYSQISPIILSSSLLKHIFELAEIVGQLIELDLTKLDNNKKYFKSLPALKDTILHNQKETDTLSKILQTMNTHYQDIDKVLEDPAVPKNAIFYDDLEVYYKYFDKHLVNLAAIMFKNFLVAQKIKLSNLDVRQIGIDTILVIPLSYLTNIKKNMSTILSQFNIQNKDELTLGLQYQRFPKVQNPYSSKSYVNIGHDTHHMQIIFHLINNLNKLFLTKKEISEIEDENLRNIFSQYYWNIHIAGHGLPQETAPLIAGMAENTFKNLLYFFNYKLNTNFIFVTSCYGAGERLLFLNIPNLNYILVIGASTKSVTIRFHEYYYKVTNNKQLELGFVTNIAQFFQELRKGRVREQSYFDTLNYIQRFWKKKAQDDLKFYYQNIPQVKLPNTDWFRIVDLQKNELILNKLLVQLHEHNKKPIIIKDKSILFLYPQYTHEYYSQKNPVLTKKAKKTPSLIKKLNELTITSDVIIKSDKTPIFISMAAGNARYNFQSLDTSSSLSRLILKLMGLPTQEYNTTFHIKSLQVKNPYKNSGSYKGKDEDIAIFSAISPSIKPASDKILLSNVTVKAKKASLKPLFRFKFEYNGLQHSIEQNSYADLRLNLKSPNLAEALIKSSAIKPTNKFNFAPTKNFHNIDEVLKKSHERMQKELLENRVRSLQVLQQTLTNLHLRSEELS